jgi:hypothetical protein
MINNVDELINAMGNNSTRIIIDKANLTTATAAGNYYSLWRASGQPGAGAPPTTAAVCDNTLTGAISFAQQTAPSASYLGLLEAISVNAGVTVELHDRLMHEGGNSGTLTTVQPVDIDLDLNLATANLSNRIGDANYSDVQWWLEWYGSTGTGASNLTVNVTYNDNTTANLDTIAVGGTAIIASRMISLNSLIPVATVGTKYIMRVNSIQLSGNTNTAGNIGVTATRYRGSVYLPVANGRFRSTWADLGLTEIYNSSCLFPIIIANATTSGVIKATGKILHG